VSPALALVEPPNYDFSIDKFQLFMPGKAYTEIEKVYGKGDLLFKKGQFTTYKFYIEHIRYKFPILVQTKDGKVTDFHANLPTYFLHDIFHQSLINRIGMQDKYLHVDEQAVYIWNNKDGVKHVYSGACSITCFPIFYAARQATHQFGMSYKPLLEQLEEKSKPEVLEETKL
jgi:hypothetical protein